MSYLVGARGGSVDTVQELIAHPYMNKLDPEFQRRLIGLFDYTISNGYTAGIGNGFRSYEGQKTSFLRNYYPVPTAEPGAKHWRYTDPSTGVTHFFWLKKANGTEFATPGNSYHEASTRAGLALAADLVGSNQQFMVDNSLRFGLKNFASRSEPWHFLPNELPNDKRHYDPTQRLQEIVFTVPRPTLPSIDRVPRYPISPSSSSSTEIYKLHLVLNYFGFIRTRSYETYTSTTFDGIIKLKRFLAGRYRVDLDTSFSAGGGTYSGATEAYLRRYLSETASFNNS